VSLILFTGLQPDAIRCSREPLVVGYTWDGRGLVYPGISAGRPVFRVRPAGPQSGIRRPGALRRCACSRRPHRHQGGSAARHRARRPRQAQPWRGPPGARRATPTRPA